MHVNYAFVLDFIKRRVPEGKILDYGCGAGPIVRAGRAERLDIFGCETFYEGSHGTRASRGVDRYQHLRNDRWPYSVF